MTAADDVADVIRRVWAGAPDTDRRVIADAVALRLIERTHSAPMSSRDKVEAIGQVLDALDLVAGDVDTGHRFVSNLIDGLIG